MITETEVTRFIGAAEIDTPHPTLVKANEEAEVYVWQRAGNGHYACKHGDTVHIIIEKDGGIGCSCGDFTHRCKDVEGCKHIAAFLHLKSPPAAKLDKRVAMDLIGAGWEPTEHGNLYPPGREGAAAAREQDIEDAMGAKWQDEHPEPEVVAELPGVDPASEDKSPKDAIPLDPDLDIGVKDDPAAMLSANCPWCGKKIMRKLAPDLKRALEGHEATCPKRPKEEEQTQKPEEEKKMEDKPAWNQEAWDSATQGSFAKFDENGVAVLIFTANDFEIGQLDKWSRPTYEFSVIQNNTAVILSVGAMRLMVALKSALPLEGKQIKITRIGEGTGTQYKVDDVTDAASIGSMKE